MRGKVSANRPLATSQPTSAQKLNTGACTWPELSPICRLKVNRATASAQAQRGARFMASANSAARDKNGKMSSAMGLSDRHFAPACPPPDGVKAIVLVTDVDSVRSALRLLWSASGIDSSPFLTLLDASARQVGAAPNWPRPSSQEKSYQQINS